MLVDLSIDDMKAICDMAIVRVNDLVSLYRSTEGVGVLVDPALMSDCRDFFEEAAWSFALMWDRLVDLIAEEGDTREDYRANYTAYVEERDAKPEGPRLKLVR